MLNIIVLTTLLILALPSTTFAHDCWLQPDSFRIGLEGLLLVRLLTGHRLKAFKELVFEKAAIPRSELYTSAGPTDLLPLSREGQTPVIEYRADFEGHGLLVMDKDFTDITLTREQFSSYLDREHHTDLLALHNNWEQREQEKERYARCMKALVQVGGQGAGAFHDYSTGQKLEILLQNNPYQRKPGQSMGVKVLFEGLPLANKSVAAHKLPVNGEASKETVTTDEDGAAVFNIEEPGLWLVRLTNIYPCDHMDESDWESYWASYCFEIPE